jgi:hypothetical protein
MKLIAAGSGKLKDGTTFSKLCSLFGIRKLLSHYGERKHIEKYDHDNVLMVDSGGHIYNKASGLNVVGFGSHKPPRPAKLEAERYLRFLDKNRDKNWVMVEPDFYGQLSVSYIDGFCQEVLSMRPKFEYIRVYHPGIPSNDKTSHSMLRKWIDQGHQYIGISKSAEDYYGEIFNITRDQVKLHGFALTGRTILEKFPFYSADSTSALVVPLKYNSTPIEGFRMLQKDKAIATRDVRYLQYRDPDDRIMESLRRFKMQETYYTKLWEKRGVVWK